jgi:Glycosyltransferase sugar-binding region containing DXD motif
MGNCCIRPFKQTSTASAASALVHGDTARAEDATRLIETVARALRSIQLAAPASAGERRGEQAALTDELISRVAEQTRQIMGDRPVAGFEGLGDAVPNKLHFIWVGRQISQENLQLAQHYAARGANVSLWTDNPQAVVRTSTSMHHQDAGSLDSSVPMAGVPAAAGEQRRSGEGHWIAIRSVEQTFEGDPSENGRALDRSQIRDSAGLGNPGARSDAVRYQVLFREGGVYTDFDRAEALRHNAVPHRLQRAIAALRQRAESGELSRDNLMKELKERYGFETTPFPSIEGRLNVPVGMNYAWKTHPYDVKANDLLAAAPGAPSIDKLRSLVKDTSEANSQSKPLRFDDEEGAFVLSNALAWMSLDDKFQEMLANRPGDARQAYAAHLQRHAMQGSLPSHEKIENRLETLRAFLTEKSDEAFTMWQGALQVFAGDPNRRPALERRTDHPSRADQMRDPATWHGLPPSNNLALDEIRHAARIANTLGLDLRDHHPKSVSELAATFGIRLTTDTTGPGQISRLVDDLLTHFDHDDMPRLFDRSGLKKRLGVSAQTLDIIPSNISWAARTRDQYPAGFEAPEAGPSKRSARGAGFEVGDPPSSSVGPAPADRGRHAGRLEDFYDATRSGRPPAQERSDRGKGKRAAAGAESDATGRGAAAAAPPAAGIRIQEPGSAPELADAQGRPFTSDALRSRIGQQLDVQILGRAHTATVRMMTLPGGQSLPVLATRHPDAPVGQQQRFTAADGRRFDAQHVAESADGQLHYTALPGGASRGNHPVARRAPQEDPRLQGGPDAPSSSSQPQRQRPGTREIEPQPAAQTDHDPAPSSAQATHSSSAARTQPARTSEAPVGDAVKDVGRFLADTRRGYAHKEMLKNAAIDFVVSATGTIAGTLVAAMQMFDAEVVDAGKATDGTPPRLSPTAQPIEPGTDITYVSGVLGSMTDGAVLAVMKEVVRRFGFATSYELPKVADEAKDALRVLGATDPSEWGQQFHEQMRRATPAQALALAKEAQGLSKKEDPRPPHMDALVHELNEFAQAKVANFYRRPGHVDERYLGRRDRLTNGALQSMLDLLSGTGDRYKKGSPSMQASRLPTGHGPGGKHEPPAKLGADRHANTIGMFMPALANGMRAFMELGAQSYFLLQKLPSIKPGQSESDWWGSILKSGKSPMAIGALAASLAARAFVNAHQMQSLGMLPKQGSPYDKAKRQHALPQGDVETGHGGRDTATNTTLTRQIADLKALAQTLSDPKAWLKAGLDNIGYKGLISAIRNQIGETHSPATKLSPASAWGNTAAVIGSALLGKAFEQIWAGAEKLLQRMRGSTDGAGGEPQAPRLQDVRVDQPRASDGSSSSTSRGSMPVSSVDTRQMHEALDWMRKALERLAAAFNAPSPLSSRHGTEDSDSTSGRQPHSMDSFWTSNPLFQSFERSPWPDGSDDDDEFFDAHETPQSEAQERGLSRAGAGHHEEATGRGDDGHSSPAQPSTAPQALSMRELFARAQEATRSEEPAGPPPPASPTGDERSDEPLPVPNRLQTIWFGRPISQEDLTTLLHFAARGGNVNLWTDDYRKAIRQDASRHSPSAGDLHSSIPIAGYPTHADPAATNPRQQLALRDVSELMASPDFRQAVVRLMSELVGLGNPGAASDVARYLLLQQEGGIYMDLDRAEQTKLKLDRPNRPIAPDDLSAPRPGGLKHPIESVGGRRMYPNDLLIAAPNAQAIQQAIDRLIEMDRLLDRGAASQDINNSARQPTSMLDMLIVLKMNLAQQVEATQADSPPRYQRSLKDQGRDPKVPQQVHDRMTVLSTGPNLVREVLPKTEAGKQQASDLRDLERLLHLVPGFLSQEAPQTFGWTGRKHPSSFESPLPEGPGRARQWEAASRGGNGDDPGAGGSEQEPAAKRRRLEPRSEAPSDASPAQDKGKGTAPAEPQQRAPRADGEGPSGAHESPYQTRHVDQSEIPDVPDDDPDLQPREPTDEELKRGGGRKDPATGRYHYDGAEPDLVQFGVDKTTASRIAPQVESKADAGEVGQLIAGGATADRAVEAATHIQSEEQLQNVLSLQTYSDGKLSLGQAVALSSQIDAAQDPSWVGTKAAWVGELVAGGATGDEAVQAVNAGRVTSYDDVTEAVAAMGQGKTAGVALGIATAKSEATESDWAMKLINAGASSTQANAAVMNIRSEEQLQNVLNLQTYSDGKLSLGQAVALSSRIDPANDPNWVGTKAAWVGELMAGGAQADEAVKAVNSGAVRSYQDVTEANRMMEEGMSSADAIRSSAQVASVDEASALAGEKAKAEVSAAAEKALQGRGYGKSESQRVSGHVQSQDQLDKLLALLDSGGFGDPDYQNDIGGAVALSSQVKSLDDGLSSAQLAALQQLTDKHGLSEDEAKKFVDAKAFKTTCEPLFGGFDGGRAFDAAVEKAATITAQGVDAEVALDLAPKISGADAGGVGRAVSEHLEAVTAEAVDAGATQGAELTSSLAEAIAAVYEGKEKPQILEALQSAPMEAGLTLLELTDLVIDIASPKQAGGTGGAAGASRAGDAPSSQGRPTAIEQALVDQGVDAKVAREVAPLVDSVDDAGKLGRTLAGALPDAIKSFKGLASTAGEALPDTLEVAVIAGVAIAMATKGDSEGAMDYLAESALGIVMDPTGMLSLLGTLSGTGGTLDADKGHLKYTVMDGMVKGLDAVGDGFNKFMAGLCDDYTIYDNLSGDFADQAKTLGGADLNSQQTAFFAAAYAAYSPGGRGMPGGVFMEDGKRATADALTQKMVDDGLAVKVGGQVMIGVQPGSDNSSGIDALSRAVMRAGTGAVTGEAPLFEEAKIDAGGLKKAIDMANGGVDSITEAQAQVLVAQYGQDGEMTQDNVAQAIQDGALKFGKMTVQYEAEHSDAYTGFVETKTESLQTIGLMVDGALGSNNPGALADSWLSASGGQVDGAYLADILRYTGTQATADADSQLSEDQMQFLVNAYAGDGSLSKDEIRQMFDDGLLYTDKNGQVSVDRTKLARDMAGGDAQAAAHAKSRMAAALLRSASDNGTTDADGLGDALNMFNTGGAEYGDELQMMVSMYGNDDGRVGLKDIEAMLDDQAIRYDQHLFTQMGDGSMSDGLLVDPNVSRVDDARLAGMLTQSAGEDQEVNGEDLAFQINATQADSNTTTNSGMEEVIGDDQTQFLINAYAKDGTAYGPEIQAMLRDGALRRTDDGQLDADMGALWGPLRGGDADKSGAAADRLASAFLLSGGGSGAQTIDTDGLANALNMANGAEGDWGDELDKLTKLYAGSDGELSHWELKQMIQDGSLSCDEGSGQVKVDPKLSNLSHDRLAQMIYDGAGTGASGDELASVVNTMNTQYMGSSDVFVGDDQAAFAIAGYSDGRGWVNKEEIKRMLDDGVLHINGKGELDFTLGAVFDNLQHSDPDKAAYFRDLAVKMITRSQGSQGDDGKWSIDEHQFDDALNMANRGESVTDDTADWFADDITTDDDADISEDNLRWALANGRIGWGNINTEWDGGLEAATGIQLFHKGDDGGVYQYDRKDSD